MIYAPQYVLDTVAAESEIAEAARFHIFFPALGPALQLGQRLSAPVVYDRVADDKALWRVGLIHRKDLGVTLAPFVHEGFAALRHGVCRDGVSRRLVQHLPQQGFVCVGYALHAQIGQVYVVDRAVRRYVHLLRREVTHVVYAFGLKLSERFASRLIHFLLHGCMVLAERSVRVAAEAGDDDRRGGMLCVQRPHGIHCKAYDFILVAPDKVGIAVENVCRGVDLPHHLDYGLVEVSVSGESEVYDGAVHLAFEDVCPCHCRARGASALGYRGAVGNDGFLLAAGHELERRTLRYAYLEPFYSIIERQVETVFITHIVVAVAFYGVVGVCYGVTEGVFPGEVSHGSVAVYGIEIHPRYARCGHVVHRQTLGYGVAHLDVRGVAVEMYGQTGRVAREIPYRLRYLLPGTFRKTHVGMSYLLLEGLILDDALFLVEWIVPCDLCRGRSDKERCDNC